MLAIRSAYAKRRFCGLQQKILEPLRVSDETELGATAISYRHMLKSGRMVLGSLRRFATFIGCDERELLELSPLLLHLEGLVYKADYYYEALQKVQVESAPDFVAGFEQVLVLYGLNTSSVRQHVNDLIAYFERETEIVCGTAEIDETVLREVTRIRSSDWRLAICVIQEVLDRPCSLTELTLLEQWYTLYEIRQDLLQYAEDATNDTYNTLRLYVRIFGPAEGVVRLKVERDRLTAEFLSAWQQTTTTQSARLWRAFHAAFPAAVLAALPWSLVKGYAEKCMRNELLPDFPSVV
jgi:hypothetical protein